MKVVALLIILLAAGWTYCGFPDFVNWKAVDLAKVFETQKECETFYKNYMVLCVPSLERME